MLITLTDKTDANCPNKKPEKKHKREFNPISGSKISNANPPKHKPNNKQNIKSKGKALESNLTFHTARIKQKKE
mgnify:CR=1 FL=1|tara:strand:- start:231 stop:452 length:222 start_codon:yes stop_codon:yes gene_type:complete